MQLLVERDADLAVTRLDAAADRIADEQDVVLAAQVRTLDNVERFAGRDFRLVVDGHLGAGGHVQSRFDHAVIAQGDADAGVGSEQRMLADGIAQLAAA